MPLPPTGPLAAVTHPEPAAYYSCLAGRPLFHDPTLGCWVASSAEAVTATLTSELCRVRPAHEPVPAALLDSPAELIFRSLMRMNDGAHHQTFKRAAQDALNAVGAARVQAESQRWAGVLCHRERRQLAAGNPDGVAFDLPVYVLGHLLGIASGHLPRLAALTREFAPCLSPGSPPASIERGKVAAGKLLKLFGPLLSRPATENRSLLSHLADLARQQGCVDPAVTMSNGIGLIWQSHEATAGLINTALLTLARNPELRASVAAGSVSLRGVLLEGLRLDPPIQNTRRFVAQGGVVAGQTLQAGDPILVVLAAACRDQAVNPQPAHFEAMLEEPLLLAFGTGPHACPGQDLALTIAEAGMERCLAGGLDLTAFAARATYRPSVNARIPVAGVGSRP